MKKTHTEVEKEIIVQTPPKRGRLVKAAEAKERSSPADEIPPAMRDALKTLRAAHLMAADALAVLLGLPKRHRDFD